MQRRIHARAKHVHSLHRVLNDDIQDEREEHELERVPEERLLARWLDRGAGGVRQEGLRWSRNFGSTLPRFRA